MNKFYTNWNIVLAIIFNLNILVTLPELDANEIDSFTIELKKGWNLISIPFVPTDNNYYLFYIFPDANVAYEFKDGTYVSVDYLKPGVGYWIQVDYDNKYTIMGTLLSKCLQGPQGSKGDKGDVGPQGVKGEKGDKGDIPEHEWNNSELKFKNPNGNWGKSVNLKGEKGDLGLPPEHEWLESSLRFKNSDGTWGKLVNLKGDTGTSESLPLSVNNTSFFIINRNFGIGTKTPNSSSILDLTSNNKGLLIPRMTSAQRDAISEPSIGMQIFNIDSSCLNYYSFDEWMEVCGNRIKANYVFAGEDILNLDVTSTTLDANIPLEGNIGNWSIISGDSGIIHEESNPKTKFTGKSGNTYTLRWTIDIGNSTLLYDDIVISFLSIEQTHRYVFVTSKKYSGNLGGLSGADTICQSSANSAGLQGTYKAWISDSSNSTLDRLYHHSGVYKLLNGVTIADNWNDLIKNTPEVIKINEYGNRISYEPDGQTDKCGWSGGGMFFAWTNTQNSGIKTKNNSLEVCQNWTNSSSSYTGVVGFGPGRPTQWTNFCAFECNMQARLYCFEQ